MKTTLFVSCSLIVLAGSAIAGTAATGRAAHDARVSVAFIHPEGFSDAGPKWSDRERDGILRGLGGSMQRSAAQYLRDDLQLEIKVKNVDLAGEFEGWRGAQYQDLRVIRDVYPPRMTIDFQLRDGRGRVLSQGESKLSNPNFLFGDQSGLDPLRHDKALFRDWLRSEFSEYRK